MYLGSKSWQKDQVAEEVLYLILDRKKRKTGRNWDQALPSKAMTFFLQLDPPPTLSKDVALAGDEKVST
jgi:hypothetical protein